MEPVIPHWVVKGVAVIGDHKLRLLFADGTVGDIAFPDSKWTGIFAPLRDPARFAKVRIEDDSICWPDDDLDMAPETLYDAALANSLTPAESAA